MKIIAYNVVCQNMLIAQVDTKREATEMVREFKRLAAIEGVTPEPYAIEAVR
jgi:hypothetical protein